MGDMTIATKTPDSAAFWRQTKNPAICFAMCFWVFSSQKMAKCHEFDPFS